MLYFKAKMHQVPISAGEPPETPRGSLQRSPGPTSWIYGGLFLRERRQDGRERRWRGEDLYLRRGGDDGRDEKGREGYPPPPRNPKSKLRARLWVVPEVFCRCRAWWSRAAAGRAGRACGARSSSSASRHTSCRPSGTPSRTALRRTHARTRTNTSGVARNFRQGCVNL